MLKQRIIHHKLLQMARRLFVNTVLLLIYAPLAGLPVDLKK